MAFLRRFTAVFCRNKNKPIVHRQTPYILYIITVGIQLHVSAYIAAMIRFRT